MTTAQMKKKRSHLSLEESEAKQQEQQQQEDLQLLGLASPAKRLRLSASSVLDSPVTPELQQVEQAGQVELQQVKQEAVQEDRNRQHFYRILQSADKETLSSILSSLLQSSPLLEKQVYSLLPKPTLKTVFQLLKDSESRLLDAFPYSKHAPGRSSDYSYNRVRPLLQELQDQLLFYLEFFVSPENYSHDNEFEYPENAMNYLNYASQLVTQRFPVWHNPLLNKETKQDLLQKLAQGWSIAVKILSLRVQEGKIYPPLTVKEWGIHLLLFAGQVHGEFGMRDVSLEFLSGLGWLFGMSERVVLERNERKTIETEVVLRSSLRA
jgi:hypothetical protein